MKFDYQSEKFSTARSMLMLPHPHGEAESVANAFHECSAGLDTLHDEDLDDTSRDWIAKLKELMDTSGIEDPSGHGRWLIKAEQLTYDQKSELSHVVDDLAHWFDRQ